MIRRPSSVAQLYAWWRGALADPDAARHDGLPECGYYKRRLVRGGPWVPVRIFVERDIDPATGELTAPERLVADVNGRREEPARHWTHLIPITREEYGALLYRQALIPALADVASPLDLTKEPLQWT